MTFVILSVFLFSLYIVEGKIFSVSWDSNCSMIRCEFVKYFVERLNGSLNYTNCLDNCDFYINLDDDTDSDMYFVEYLNVRMIIPRNPKLNRELYIFLPFKFEVWILFVFSIFYIPTILNIVNFEKTDWIANFIKCFQTIMSSGSTFSRSEGLITFINYLVILYSFLIYNIYPSFLGSFLVKDTQSIPTICPDIYFNYEYDHYGIQFKSLPFKHYTEVMDSLNTSFGYCVTVPYEEFFKKNLNNNIFSFRSEILYTLEPLYFFKEKYSYFANDFKTFILDIYSSGFVTYWGIKYSELSVLRSLRRIEFERDIYNDMVLNMDEFLVPFILYFIGLILGLISFSIEIASRFKF